MLGSMTVYANDDEFLLINPTEVSQGQPIKMVYKFKADQGKDYIMELRHTDGSLVKSWNLSLPVNKTYLYGSLSVPAPEKLGQYEFNFIGPSPQQDGDNSDGLFSNILICIGSAVGEVVNDVSNLELQNLAYIYVNSVFEIIGEVYSFLGIGNIT